MAELTGSSGFAPPRNEDTPSGRRATTIEMVATVGLTVALVVAVTAVSLGNRSLGRGENGPHSAVQNPARMLLDQTDDWLSLGARFSARPQ